MSGAKEGKCLMQVVFRVDASSEIGTGHVIRCLTLAKALRKREVKCEFICRPHVGNLIDLIRREGFEVTELSSSGNSGKSGVGEISLAHENWLGVHWREDSEGVILALNGRRSDWLIVDHYALDSRWEKTLRPYFKKIMAIDDLADRVHDCDVLLDQSLVEDWSRRYEGLTPANCRHLLGPQYALLQSEYTKCLPFAAPRLKHIRNILIFFGGVDNLNLTGMAIQAFTGLNRSDISLDVVISSSSIHSETIKSQIQFFKNITLHETLPSLAQLILKADLAIGASGTTTWERCCLGLPSLVVTVAKNQRLIAKVLHERGIVRWLGDPVDVSSNTIQAEILRLLNKEGEVKSWSERCKGVVDGRGADRMAMCLTLSASSQVKVRPACIDDETLLLGWKNDLAVRLSSFNSSEVDLATHRDWFYRKLRNQVDCRIYIIASECNLPIGQVRFDFDGTAWNIDYSLDFIARGRGLGVKILQDAIKALKQSTEGQILLLGLVKPENKASQRVFERIGFSILEKTRELISYRFLV